MWCVVGRALSVELRVSFVLCLYVCCVCRSSVVACCVWCVMCLCVVWHVLFVVCDCVWLSVVGLVCLCVVWCVRCVV